MNVRIALLRRLPAFRAFEAEVRLALQSPPS